MNQAVGIFKRGRDLRARDNEVSFSNPCKTFTNESGD